MYDPKQHEHDILAFWNNTRIFERSVQERSEENPFVFYDGPPFATGMPHYGHIMAGTKKDVIPRFKTMQGYRVERQWGWDCHGLPIENLIEKELDLPGKQEIEEYGIDKFNEACRDKVMEYADEWQRVIPRMGRWIDMEHPYKTMDKSFMESVWWVFSELYKKDLIYEGKKPMHICPHCVTPLSNFEVSQGYKDIKDLSVVARFLVDSQQTTDNSFATDLDAPLYLLAWTTTPWTLPGNILVAVGADLEYSLVKHEGAYYVVAKDLLMHVFDGKEFQVVQQLRGSDLVGLNYEPLFPYFATMDGAENGFRVVTADFVNTDDGTGLVHLAPAFGTDDYEVFRKENVPFIQHVNMDGTFTNEVTDFAGMQVKPEDNHMATDIEIIKWLAHNEKLFSKKKYEHSYPHCWRCDTPLLNYATSSWFVEVTKIKDELIANNQKINWVPEHIKDGRFGKWLENVRDWSISRNRFWGTPLPVWRCQTGNNTNDQTTKNPKQNCDNVVVFGSVADLEDATGQTVVDLHKHLIDPLTFDCEKCGGEMRRVDDVLDTWFDSGSVPYGQWHYPFENKEKFERGFPADFIAESQDQTRGWFYTLHVLATALTSGESSVPVNGSQPAFKNVSVNGMVLAEDGKKMSKRLKNYPDPMDVVEKYGADALRYYLLSSPVMVGDSLNFSEKGLREVFNKVVNTLWNVVTFYEMFSDEDTRHKLQDTSDHVLDRWVLARLEVLKRDVTEGLEAYKLHEATRPIMDFILDVSQWYVRRSRDRFKGDDAADRAAAMATLQHVLVELSKVMAPFTPFLAEKIWQDTRYNNQDTSDSVHLAAWPQADDALRNQEVLEQMVLVRDVVEVGLALRKEANIKVRQPLGQFQIADCGLQNEYVSLVADELNVKDVEVVDALPTGDAWQQRKEQDFAVALSTEITPELKKEGLVRELTRTINRMRKKQGLTRDDRIVVHYHSEDTLINEVFVAYADELKDAVLADELVQQSGGDVEQVDGVGVALSLNHVTT